MQSMLDFARACLTDAHFYAGFIALGLIVALPGWIASICLWADNTWRYIGLTLGDWLGARDR